MEDNKNNKMEIIAQPTYKNKNALSVLKNIFGFDSFRPPQEAIVTDVIAGKDVLVLMPTGGGKSLCYQIPSLVRPGVAIIISPLIALMEDQVAALKLQGVQAAYYNSSLSGEESRTVSRATASGRIKFTLYRSRAINDALFFSSPRRVRY